MYLFIDRHMYMFYLIFFPPLFCFVFFAVKRKSMQIDSTTGGIDFYVKCVSSPAFLFCPDIPLDILTPKHVVCLCWSSNVNNHLSGHEGYLFCLVPIPRCNSNILKNDEWRALSDLNVWMLFLIEKVGQTKWQTSISNRTYSSPSFVSHNCRQLGSFRLCVFVFVFFSFYLFKVFGPDEKWCTRNVIGKIVKRDKLMK